MEEDGAAEESDGNDGEDGMDVQQVQVQQQQGSIAEAAGGLLVPCTDDFIQTGPLS